jgi:GT2 family glycosyltransferase
LYLTQDYKFRTKIDNDIIFAGTRTPTVVREGVKKMKKKKRLQKEMEESIGGGPDGPGYNMPREPSRAGSGFTKRTYKPVPFRRGTEFLYHLVDFHRESGADMVSLVPLSPENSFIDEHKKACTNLFMDAPYLRGGCVMITKAGFDKCGYYNEKIERMGDLDYSRRIMKAGLNIGYHPRYWVQHNGHELYTEGPNLASTRQQMARHYMENTPTVINMGTKWEKKGKAILAAAAKTDIVNIE